MKYKAGIPPPRPKSNKRLSEYQLQFKWRDAVPSAPLIAAEQVSNMKQQFMETLNDLFHLMSRFILHMIIYNIFLLICYNYFYLIISL